MAGFVETTVAEIDSRMEELKAEMTKLQAARSALTKSAAGRQPARSRTTSTSSRPARRAPRGRSRSNGTRGDQAMALVRSKPGITIPELASSMGIEPNYLYRVMPKLVSSGQVRREGQGWFATDAAGGGDGSSR